MTSDEIAGIPIVADLDEAQRERLSVAAADISLRAGEFTGNQGDDRALFAVLEG